MKVWFATVGILAAASAFATRAEAQNYPWCANYGSAFGDGGTNCGFTTLQQCMATVSGIGGSCDRNTQYVPSGSGAPHRQKHHRQNASD